MQIASLGFRTDIGLRRLGGAEVVQRDGHLVVRTPSNPSFWWGNFVLLESPPSPGDAERLRSIFNQEFPDASHLAVGVDGTAGASGDPEVIATLGLRIEVNAVLRADQLGPARPAAHGAVFRTLRDQEDYAQAVTVRLAVYEESDSAERRGFTEGQFRAAREVCERGQGAWFGAFIDGRLVASLGMLKAAPGIGRFQDVETLAEYRRQGLAGRLLCEAGRYANEVLEARELVIAADPSYHAIELYRAVGFTVVEQQVQLERAPAS